LSEPGPRGAGGPDGRLPALGPLALARGTVDRMTERRTDPAWLADRWADPDTRVLVVDDGQALVRFGQAAAELVLLPPAQAPDGLRCFLGIDGGGRAYFSVTAPLPSAEAAAGPASGGDGQAPGGSVKPAALRQVGALLGDRDAGLFTQAVALANWHATHTHCPRCGALTDPVNGGYSRICRADGSEHFPRTDPAVIMLVTDAADRALLARNSRWPERRVSVLAGFVEPGESAEQAVAREVAEETGISVGEIRYLGSQPWPMPQSLMLGFWARASGSQPIRVDEEEIAEAHWFSRDELRAAMASDEIRLPPPVSIAHRIIEAWYGEELPAQW
jgi:NAD+ diphosphatase